ncbi:MAG: ATP-binding protein [Pseudomonadota bacterium]
MAVGASQRNRANKRFAVSRLALTILLANLIGLVILLVGSLGVTQYRDGLVQSKLEGVRAQAQLIADVLAQTAIEEPNCAPLDEVLSDRGRLCQRSLREADVREVFNRVWDSFEGRVRVFNAPDFTNNPPVANASDLLLEDVVLRADAIVEERLAPIGAANPDSARWAIVRTTENALKTFMTGGFRKSASRRTIEAELNEALASSPFVDDTGAASVRFDENGELVASVSVPIRKVQAIYGVVTAEIGGIDDLVAEARRAILPFFGLAIAATVLSSLLLTATIAQPIRQLAIAADKVREGISAAGRARIPDYSYKRDEIGELSMSLKSMTQAIYQRIEAIETFASDVAHELKNPLTSIRSATETLDLAKTPEARAKLMGVIKKDVERMDRLITDISNASRLDAELGREAREAVDLRKLLSDIVDLYDATRREDDTPVSFDPSGSPVYLFGNPSALGQVFRNLIDNARSFSPDDGQVIVVLDPGSDKDPKARVFVEDDGPGIPPDALEKIFGRFYTKRPQGAAFGNNSGLGLAISRQIIESHNGRIWAENRGGPGEAPLGARFIVEIPLA